MKQPSKKITTFDIALYGVLIAVLFVSKRALDTIPNVELVSLLFIIYARNIGRPAFMISFAFTGLECLVWGIHNWVIMYLYMWPLLILIVLMTKERGTHIFYCFLSAFFGLFFGLLCSVPYLVTSGPQAAFAWWVAGIPFDIIHCISNFCICLILFKPLDQLLDRLLKTRSA